MKKDDEKTSNALSIFSEVRDEVKSKKVANSSYKSLQQAYKQILDGVAQQQHFDLAKKFMQDNKKTLVEKYPTAEKLYDDLAGLDNDTLGFYFHRAFETLYPKDAKEAMNPTPTSAPEATPTVTVAAPPASESKVDNSKYDLRKISETISELFNREGDKLVTIEKSQNETTYKPESNKLEAYEAIAEQIGADHPQAEIKVEGGTEEQRLEIIQSLRLQNPDIKFDQKTQDFYDEHKPSSPAPS